MNQINKIKKKHSFEEKKSIVNYWISNTISRKEVCEKFDIKYQTFVNWTRSYIDLRTYGYNIIEKNELNKLKKEVIDYYFKSNDAGSNIAKKFNLPAYRVRSWINSIKRENPMTEYRRKNVDDLFCI